MAEQTSWWLRRLAVPASMVVLLVGKLLLVHSQFHAPLSARPFWLGVTLFTLCALLSIGLNFGERWGNGIALLINGLLSFLLWGDLQYYRLFTDWPSVSSLVASHQLGAASQSLFEVTRLIDLWLFIDLPFWCLVCFRKPSGVRPGGRAPRWVPLALTLSLPLGGLSFLAFSLARPELVPIRHDNVELIQYHGVLLYHAYDVVCYTSTLVRPLAAPPIDDNLEVFRTARESVGESAPYFGVHKGANVIVVQLESMESFPIGLKVNGREVTPVLNELVKTSLWAEAFDQTLQGSSSDGEFIYLNGLHPPTFGPLVYHFPDVRYLALPKLLSERGYVTQSVMPYHSRFWNRGLMDRAYGFDSSLYKQAFKEPPGSTLDWGLKDAPLFEQYLTLLPTGEKPFFSYLVTVMMHHPFPELPAEEQRLELGANLEGTLLGRYLQQAAARDAALGSLVEGLEAKGLWEQTVLVLVGDHRSRMADEEKARLELPGSPQGDRVLMLIRCPGATPKGKVDHPVGQVDLMPTLLHLLG
ncbi:MAG: LTA synthase family protein, partial [Candidatus Eremiobacteraeota bacterium]|nr:LTA synthase family protein [Candidatus Eremiobacteraeota bacterium]